MFPSTTCFINNRPLEDTTLNAKICFFARLIWSKDVCPEASSGDNQSALINLQQTLLGLGEQKIVKQPLPLDLGTSFYVSDGVDDAIVVAQQLPQLLLTHGHDARTSSTQLALAAAHRQAKC
jgi:hypothetical protein